jgi:prepilin signal peptidase PulO-like enzyme (type II secretory pathway)
MSPWQIALVAVVYGGLAYLGLEASRALCAKIEPFADGPKPGKPPVALLIAGATLIGGVLAYQNIPPPTVVMLAIVTAALAASWDSDVRCGIIPDYFTLIPLGIVLLYAVVTHEWMLIFSVFVIFFPFAVAAQLSHGRGMGWGDVKLAALGGGVLGWYDAYIAFAAACLVAVALAFIMNRRKEPIAFGPYLALAIACKMLAGH